MPVELRKRPPPKEPATPAPASKRGGGGGGGAGSAAKKLADKAKAAVAGAGRGSKTTDESGAPTAATTESSNGHVNGKANDKISVGQTLNLQGFGGTIQTNDGVDTTLKELVEKSGAGIVVFTYPRASTPGCTTQACLFRDNYAPITGASLSIYGLSTDSPKANTTFVTKQKLQYPLLCDPNATLTSAIGMKKPGPGKSTTRGVVVIDKQGVVRVWEQAGPAKTLEVVLDYVKTQGMTETGAPAAVAAPPAADATATEAAAKLADPDTKMDEVPLAKTPTPEEVQAATTAAEVGETAAKLDGGASGLLKP